ncbi:MAG: hypothetical protein M5U15_01535 [Kiritimatiellae bacterium]|nr:hypothetical protein [Kiritimatiellia bacterium]
MLTISLWLVGRDRWARRGLGEELEIGGNDPILLRVGFVVNV